MSKKSREAIRDNLARAIAPPPAPAASKRSAHLDGLLDEYAPPEQETKSLTALTSVAETLISDAAPSPREPNKVLKEKDIKESAHTLINAPAAGVRVASRFTLKQCIAYAEHRKTFDPNIRSAEAIGRKLHETGREDELIADWLNAKDKTPLDISQCPDCHGAGMYYPEGLGKGAVKKCTHEKLKTAEAARE